MMLIIEHKCRTTARLIWFICVYLYLYACGSTVNVRWSDVWLWLWLYDCSVILGMFLVSVFGCGVCLLRALFRGCGCVSITVYNRMFMRQWFIGLMTQWLYFLFMFGLYFGTFLAPHSLSQLDRIRFRLFITLSAY